MLWSRQTAKIVKGWQRLERIVVGQSYRRPSYFCYIFAGERHDGQSMECGSIVQA